MHSKAVIAGQRRCSASIHFAGTRPDLTFQRQASHALSYRGKSIFAFQCTLTISHSIEFTPNRHVADFIANKLPSTMLRRSIISDRANPLHRRGLVMIVELSFDEASAIPTF
jgi:hypothetical protein